MKKFSARIYGHRLLTAFRVLKYYNRQEIIPEDIKLNLRYLKNKVLDYRCGEEVRYIFNNSFVDKYLDGSTNIPSILKDLGNGLLYVMHNGKRMYMKRSFNETEALQYYKSILIEQDKDSPHCYFVNKENMTDKVVIDCGAAEGIFMLDYIQEVRELFMFEPDLEWVEALSYTYGKWKDKVHIIPKFIGKNDDFDKNIITLDSYFGGEENKINIIKLDIEGEEINAIIGAKKIIDNQVNVRWLVCVYHNQNDEYNITELLADYKKIERKGNMLMIWRNGSKLAPPYFRKGVIEYIR